MPATYDLTLWRGNDETRSFTFKQADESAFDLTGSTLIFSAKWRGGSLVQNLTITNAAAGAATLSLTYAQTRTLPDAKAVEYEIERRIGGVETTLLAGAVTVLGGVNTDA